jgi:hypothetical protein
MPTTKRGKGSVSGIAGTFDVILYPVLQTAKFSHKIDLKVVQDAQGDDAAWKWNNEQIEGDWMMKLLGDTNAHAKAGAAFLTPGAVITCSGFDSALINTTWNYMGDGTIDLKNDDVGDIGFKVRKYVDATQNTAFSTAPS